MQIHVQPPTSSEKNIIESGFFCGGDVFLKNTGELSYFELKSLSKSNILPGQQLLREGH